MKDKKSSYDATGHWALDAYSHYPWRKSHQKNQTRDFRKFAIAAYHEERLVSEYRQKLFDSSEVAKFLRTALGAWLSSFLKPGKTEYEFPDTCQRTARRRRPQFDIEDVIENNDRIAYITKGLGV